MILKTTKFSYYKAPITNTVPHSAIDLTQLYVLLTGNYLAKVTREVRTASDYKKAKATMLPYITPAGIFRRRHTSDVVRMSGLISLDFDNVDVNHAKEAVTKFEGVQLVYISPSGKGVKALILNPYQCDTYSEEFARLKSTIQNSTGLLADNTPDLARACFVCHDPEAWINPESYPQV